MERYACKSTHWRIYHMPTNSCKSQSIEILNEKGNHRLTERLRLVSSGAYRGPVPKGPHLEASQPRLTTMVLRDDEHDSVTW